MRHETEQQKRVRDLSRSINDALGMNECAAEIRLALALVVGSCIATGCDKHLWQQAATEFGDTVAALLRSDDAIGFMPKRSMH